jgi:hypothetical protein
MAKVEGQRVEVTALPITRPNLTEHLREAWKHVVEEEEWVLRKVGPVTLQKVGVLVTEGSMRVRDAIECFLRLTDKPMIGSRDAVLTGLSQACREKLVGIGRGMDPTKLQKRWCGEEVMLDPNEDGIWIIPPFEKEVTPEKQDESSTTITTDVTSDGEQRAGSATGTIAKEIRTIRISGDVPVENWSDIFRSFVSPSARMDLKELKLGIEFVLTAKTDKPLNPDDPAIKSFVESARQLGLRLQFNQDQD